MKNKDTKFKPGQVANPRGRPKGSRNKFAEEFVKDFLADWEKNGKKAIKRARQSDPVAYLRVASSLIPKDFNINVNDEASLDKLLDQYDDEQLEAIFAAINTVGTSDKAKASKKKIRTKSNSIH